MRQPHGNEHPGAAATASGQIENRSNAQIAPPIQADNPEPSTISRACRELPEPLFGRRHGVRR